MKLDDITKKQDSMDRPATLLSASAHGESDFKQGDRTNSMAPGQ